MTFTEQRAMRASRARSLEQALGPYVTVIFDAYESGYTSFYINTTEGLMEYNMAPNSLFDDEIIVGDYSPKQGVLAYYYNRNMLVSRNY